MCGIVGYIGNNNPANVVIAGLKRLEYRGYDSAGVAVIGSQAIVRRRAEGKLQHLQAALSRSPIKGRIGIAHTRWATHGAPTEANAHPQIDAAGEIDVGWGECHQERSFPAISISAGRGRSLPLSRMFQ